MARAISVDQEEKQPGLLSRAFAPGSSFARAVSLHNLLDVQHLDTLPETVRCQSLLCPPAGRLIIHCLVVRCSVFILPQSGLDATIHSKLGIW